MLIVMKIGGKHEAQPVHSSHCIRPIVTSPLVIVHDLVLLRFMLAVSMFGCFVLYIGFVFLARLISDPLLDLLLFFGEKNGMDSAKG